MRFSRFILIGLLLSVTMRTITTIIVVFPHIVRCLGTSAVHELLDSFQYQDKPEDVKALQGHKGDVHRQETGDRWLNLQQRQRL